MQRFLPLAFFILVAICSLLGCQDAPTDILLEEQPPAAAAQDETQPPEPITTQPTPADTFARLRNVFPETMLDADFTALRKVTRSRLYLEFLAQEYPTAPPVETLEAYYRRVPDAARYGVFLKPWIPRPLETDIEVTHQIVLHVREIEISLFKSFQENNPNIFALLELAANPSWDNEEVDEWLARHDNIAEDSKFTDALLPFAKESLREDAAWLHELFEARGTNDGLLWCALRKPALTGEILTHFSDTATFLTWVEEKSGETKE